MQSNLIFENYHMIVVKIKGGEDQIVESNCLILFPKRSQLMLFKA